MYTFNYTSHNKVIIGGVKHYYYLSARISHAKKEFFPAKRIWGALIIIMIMSGGYGLDFLDMKRLMLIHTCRQ